MCLARWPISSCGRGACGTAAGYWRKALAAIQKPESWGRLPLPVIGWVFIRMGELLYEWNELAAAWDHLSRGLERAELGGDVRALIAGYVLAARLKLTAGDIEAAAAYLEQARPLVEQAAFPDWTSRFERCQLELWLAQDRLRAAVDWADEMLRGDALEERPEQRDCPSGDGARADRQRGCAIRRTSAGAARAPAPQRRKRRAGWASRSRRWRFRPWRTGRRGDRAGAMTALERALRLAEPEGYVRLFADLGLPMARLLQEARSRARDAGLRRPRCWRPAAPTSRP